jgi:hypothetical protein
MGELELVRRNCEEMHESGSVLHGEYMKDPLGISPAALYCSKSRCGWRKRRSCRQGVTKKRNGRKRKQELHCRLLLVFSTAFPQPNTNSSND